MQIFKDLQDFQEFRWLQESVPRFVKKIFKNFFSRLSNISKIFEVLQKWLHMGHYLPILLFPSNIVTKISQYGSGNFHSKFGFQFQKNFSAFNTPDQIQLNSPAIATKILTLPLEVFERGGGVNLFNSSLSAIKLYNCCSSDIITYFVFFQLIIEATISWHQVRRYFCVVFVIQQLIAVELIKVWT